MVNFHGSSPKNLTFLTPAGSPLPLPPESIGFRHSAPRSEVDSCFSEKTSKSSLPMFFPKELMCQSPKTTPWLMSMGDTW